MSLERCTDIEEHLDDAPPEQSTSLTDVELSRRSFVKAAGILTAAAATGIPHLATAEDIQAAAATTPQMMNLTLKVNGTSQTLSSTPAPRSSTPSGNIFYSPAARRDATTASAEPAPSSLTAAASTPASPSPSPPTEPRSPPSKDSLTANPHPVQEAFLEHDGFQCGYCTPGQICSAVALLKEHKHNTLSTVSFETGHTSNPELTDNEIRERMSGNICRCGAYPNIVAAVRAAAKGMSA